MVLQKLWELDKENLTTEDIKMNCFSKLLYGIHGLALCSRGGQTRGISGTVKLV